MLEFLKMLLTKLGLLGTLFVILLLLPMGWPIIIIIMVIAVLAAIVS